MKKIRINRIELAELIALYKELFNYVTYNSAVLHSLKDSDAYFTKILMIDIAQSMCYSFRGKCEGSAKLANLVLRANEACILMQICSSSSKFRNGFEEYVMKKYTGILHKELIGLI